ncbi:MAG: DUF624 domain-containing protein [Clostridiales Family XIII bacterium]|nr:DUF624 domain-containing protein [Clostridiales Family XIII bacterium]
MRNLFNMDGGLMSFLFRLTDLIKLNVVFFVCCIPIVTIGPALTALYSVTMKLVKKEDPYVVKSFFMAFKANFKMSLLAWLLLLVAGAVAFIDYRLSLTYTGILGQFLPYLFFVWIFICLIIMLYLFPYISKFEDPLKRTLKNTILMAITNLPYTLLLLAISGIAAFLFLSVIPIHLGVMYYILLGFSVLAYLHSFIFRIIFAKYTPEKETIE